MWVRPTRGVRLATWGAGGPRAPSTPGGGPARLGSGGVCSFGERRRVAEGDLASPFIADGARELVEVVAHVLAAPVPGDATFGRPPPDGSDRAAGVDGGLFGGG